MMRLIKNHIRATSIACVFLMAGVWYYLWLPDNLFDDPYSTVLLSREGELLSASIASDGQWRFPHSPDIPSRFEAALLSFEDKRFYHHPGIDPLAIARALRQNLSSGKKVSGGSTITMQLARLSRKQSSRTILNKLRETLFATRLEFTYSKKEILSLYAAHAPFGGNVVGIEAACWRYFGRSSHDLSWGEAALLAVLPNAPSLIHPGKNRDLLKNKRDFLLEKLFAKDFIDTTELILAKAERLPEKTVDLPQQARHLLAKARRDGRLGKIIVSTIDNSLQKQVESRLQAYHEVIKHNRIMNGAVVVLDVRSGNVLAYAGNVARTSGSFGEDVDIISSPRSTGSILKPVLYAAALDEGLILPRTLLPDVPVLMNGFSPQNFSREYDGAVSADQALIRSLNVPAVHLLKDYRYEKFHQLLRLLGLTSLKHPPDHYGLSLILGGAEGSLWEITGVYASMARTLNNYFEYPGSRRYRKSDFHAPQYIDGAEVPSPLQTTSWLSASSIFLTFQALKELHRPGEESGWRYFNASRRVAWKTGTSFGLRDAWAVGVTPDYAVGVWIGNADGEGRAGLTGTDAAAPLLFDIFRTLPGTTWFKSPHSELISIPTCRQSGQRISMACDERDSVLSVRASLNTSICQYHTIAHVSVDGSSRVHAGCAEPSSITAVKWFVLPPVQEHYFKKKNLSYKTLPPFRADCSESLSSSMDLIYPKPDAKILLPRDFGGRAGTTVFVLAHQNERISVFWHLDGEFLGATKGAHRMAIAARDGPHTLTLVDENGESLQQRFTVISRL